ncbi:MAG: hypothetical protein FWD68_01125 [Alphaproteobacteria bacterium]|nr:hypothetical protein [Alphaproteobacteria bacterium]
MMTDDGGDWSACFWAASTINTKGIQKIFENFPAGSRFVELQHAPTLSGRVEIAGPLLHELAALCERSRAPVRGLDLVTDHMGKGHLRYLARELRTVASPIAKR